MSNERGSRIIFSSSKRSRSSHNLPGFRRCTGTWRGRVLRRLNVVSFKKKVSGLKNPSQKRSKISARERLRSSRLKGLFQERKSKEKLFEEEIKGCCAFVTRRWLNRQKENILLLFYRCLHHSLSTVSKCLHACVMTGLNDIRIWNNWFIFACNILQRFFLVKRKLSLFKVGVLCNKINLKIFA